MKVKGDEGYETQQELFQFDIIHGQSIGQTNPNVSIHDADYELQLER